MQSGLRSRDNSVHVTDERINTITSLVGSMISLFISALIIYRAFEVGSTWYQLTAVFIYTGGLVNLFVMSTLHHGLKLGKRAEDVFRTLDYCAIFWLTAGTITAVVAYIVPSGYGMTVLIATWLLAAAGVALRASLPNLPRHITNTLFITLGWLPALALLAVSGSEFISGQFVSLALGGFIYSIGFVIYVAERPNLIPKIFGFHELWHILVIIAATIHAVLIYTVIK